MLQNFHYDMRGEMGLGGGCVYRCVHVRKIESHCGSCCSSFRNPRSPRGIVYWRLHVPLLSQKMTYPLLITLISAGCVLVCVCVCVLCVVCCVCVFGCVCVCVCITGRDSTRPKT